MGNQTHKRPGRAGIAARGVETGTRAGSSARPRIEPLESRTMLAVAPAGPETRVNTTIANSQSFPATAMDADGDYVVVWQSYGQDPGSGVYAQRYSAAGLARGGEFRVPTTTAANQTRPVVAMDADGDFVVAWESNDGSESGVYAQRFNAAGVAQGSEFRANTQTTHVQRYPSVAMDADGDFVITWQSTNQDLVPTDGVYAQRYSAAGVPRGGEFRVNTRVAGNQWFPAAAMDADGDFVIAWESTAHDPDASTGVYAQRFDAAGAAAGAEFRVNTFTVSNQGNPAAAMDADGDFVISWTSQNGTGTDNIYAQRFNAGGVAIGGELLANTFTTTSQRFSSVAMDSDGDFVVTWQSYYQDPLTVASGIYGQRFSALGSPQGIEIRVNTHAPNHQRHPAVAMDADGDFVVAWASYGQDAGDSQFVAGVYAQRYSDTSAPKVTQVYANSTDWTAAFRNYVGAQALGSSQFGFAIAGGSAQLLPLPWTSVNQISIAFSVDVSVQQADLALRGVNVPAYATSAFAYDPVLRTATWTLAQNILNDRVLLDLDADAPNGVKAAAGGQYLDGEWAAGNAYPSGNGAAGGDFRFGANALRGNADRAFDRVNAADQGYVKARLNRSTTNPISPIGGAPPYSIFADVTGDGRINAADQGAVKARINSALPAANPAGAPAGGGPPTFGETALLSDDLAALLA